MKKIDKLKVKLRDKTEILNYENVGRVEIADGFLIITYELNSMLRTEPIDLSFVDYWECKDD